jgi:uncharacterized protein YgiB involved in biofilm formation
MKRSRHVALVLLAGSLAACDDKPKEDTVFQTMADCRKVYDEAVCRQKFDEAARLHEQSAPRFQTQAQCEALYGAGACTPTNVGGGSWFIPAMMGFMIARALSAPPVPLYYGPLGAPQRPDRDRDERPVYSGSSYYGGVSGSSGRPFSASAPAGSVQTASLSTPSVAAERSGFGATGRSYSSGGG